MILGLSLQAFTTLHVAISLVGILTGLVVVAAMILGKDMKVNTAVFLATTVLTSATGFLFPSTKIDPAQIVGGLSLVILVVALAALYGKHLIGIWRPIYVITAVAALYLNCFVAVVQGFGKIPALKALAPTGSEPPFKIAQLIVLVLFVALGVLATRRFHKVPAVAPAV